MRPSKRSESEAPLDEIYRQLVSIHVSPAQALDTDADIRRWALGRVNTLLKYVEDELEKGKATRGA
jgi:hypothetical protein